MREQPNRSDDLNTRIVILSGVERPLLLRDLTDDLRIAHFAQDRGPLGSGGRGNVRRQAAPGLISQQCECRGFFASAASRTRRWFRTRILGGEYLADDAHQRCVLGSTAGDDEFPKTPEAVLPVARQICARPCRSTQAVVAVAVATMSFSSARLRERRNSHATRSQSCTRPAVLGGFPEERMPEHLLQRAFNRSPTQASRPLRSSGRPNRCSVTTESPCCPGRCRRR